MILEKIFQKPRIVVAGKVPPPIGGQNLLIADLLCDLKLDSRCLVEHLDLGFTKNWSQARRLNLFKIFQIAKIYKSMRRIAHSGPVDLLVYPAGGPQSVPLFRDALLIPLLRPYCKKFLIHFHAAGYAQAYPNLNFLLRKIVSKSYASVDEAIVMTEFGREDSIVANIQKIHVCPNQILDTFDKRQTQNRGSGEKIHILYLGHVYEEKGIFDLLEAVRNFNEPIELKIVGDCLAPWTAEKFQRLIREMGLKSLVIYKEGIDRSQINKELAFADFLVFPSRAHESFGLVLAEAMMWSLPIVAFDWRGNKEVTGSEPGGILMLNKDRVKEIREALLFMIQNRQLWSIWGERNRKRFVENFRKSDTNPRIVDLLVKIASSKI